MIPKSQHIKRIITAVIVSTIISGLIFTVTTAAILSHTDIFSLISLVAGKSTDKMSKVESILNAVMNGYIEELDENKLIDGAIDGMLEAVNDPYTYYLSAKEFEGTLSYKDPSFVGLGIGVDTASIDDAVRITEIYSGSHLTELGIKADDEIVAIDGQRFTAANKSQILDLCEGKEGTFVNITIRRNNTETQYSVERRTVRMDLAFSKVYGDSIGYLRLRSFQNSADTDFKKHLDSLLNQNITGLIIDLRGNGGGYKSVAVNIANYLLPKDALIYSSTNNAGKVTSDKANGQMITVPFVLLVDKASASASELVAGAIQDHKTGLLIGATTFGKGIVQYTYRLEDGSYYQYTAETWYTPNGNLIHGEGLTPDIEVLLDSELVKYIDANPSRFPDEAVDLQFKAAIDALS